MASAALALLALFFGGLTTYRKGWTALANRNLNINALMSIAVTGAFLIGQWPEAAMNGVYMIGSPVVYPTVAEIATVRSLWGME